jgi:hypothetical protein
MSTKLKPITVWLEPELLDRAAQLARQDKRPLSQLLRVFIANAVVAASRHAEMMEAMNG